MSYKETVCVVGHKNPDTDSICSAIAYAYLKNQLQGKDGPKKYVPCRAGAVSPETQYVLERFRFRQPRYLENIGTRVKDMEIRRTPGVDGKISVKDAWEFMKTHNVFTLAITDEKDHLKGLVTTNDIAKSYMDENDSAIVSVAKTPYRNILKALDAEMVVGDPGAALEKGKVIIAAANPDVMENYIDPHDCVILGNRYEAQLMAILAGAGCIIVCLGAPVSKTIQHMAREHGTTVIVTNLDTYTVARLINQCMPIDFFMKSDDLMTFGMYEYTAVIQETMMKKRYRDFPIVNNDGCYIGTISRRNMMAVRKRALILVDHNEVSQAVDNVENAEILEVIDHHRLGSLETVNPVFFRNEPVGCTATIIWQMYHEKNVPIPENIAGLLCSAILSDTLVFRSPTCTILDKQAAQELAAIAKIDPEEYAKEMFAAASTLLIGIGQVTSMSQPELDEIAVRMKPFLEKQYTDKGLDLAFFMLTNIIEEDTIMLCYGKSAGELIKNAFGVEVKENEAKMKTVVSRKKQVVPAIMDALNRDQDV